MSSPLDIRQLRREDAASLLVLRRESLESEPLSFGSSPDDDRLNSLDSVQDSLDNEAEQAVFGQFDGDTLTGMVGLFRQSKVKRQHRAIIWGMFVVPPSRNRGVGRALLEAAIQYARSWGVRHLHLGVTDADPSAKRLYESAGFIQWGTERRSLQWEGRFADEHHLVLDLAPVPQLPMAAGFCMRP